MSEPPGSESHFGASTITVQARYDEDENDSLLGAGIEDDGDDSVIDDEVEISAYVRNEFDFYDENDLPEEPDPASKFPKNTDAAEKSRYPFKKLTPVETFEDYLQFSDEVPYEVIYMRTAHVSSLLAELQREFMSLEKEINQHEGIEKGTKERADEAAREVERQRTEIHEKQTAKAIANVSERYKIELKFRGEDWERFLANFKRQYPNDLETLAILHNLKDPQFIAALKKRQNKEESAKYENVPVPETRLTKEEEKLEKRRKLGLGVLDPIVFDDKKQADVYGQEHSARWHHIGDQPLKLPGDMESITGRSTRQPRQSSRKKYDEGDSVTPEEEYEPLPAKRSRKPRTFGDNESGPRSRGQSQSRDATPGVKRFQSGKRVGRPPNPSKLQNVQSAPTSDKPQLGLQEATELQQAAEALISKTTAAESSFASASSGPSIRQPVSSSYLAPKKRHAGGRPRKVVVPPSIPSRPSTSSSSETDSSIENHVATRRSVRAKSKTHDAHIDPGTGEEPESSNITGDKPKRKRKRRATESTIAVADPSEVAPEPAPITKKRKTTRPAPTASATPVQNGKTEPAPSASATASKVKKAKAAPPPARPASTRIRKPTRIAMGLDGVDDYDDDVESALDEQFTTEYESYQALTSAGYSALGKRKRRSLINLREAMRSDEEEDE